MLAELEHKRRREISMSAGRRESRAPGDNGHGNAHGSPGLRANRDGVFQKLEAGHDRSMDPDRYLRHESA